MTAVKSGRSDPAAPGSPWRAVAIATAVALASSGIVSADRAHVPRIIGATAGATAALLGVLALPSFPTRRITLALLAFGGLAAARHAALPGIDVKILSLWAVATLVALLLVDRAQADATPLLANGPPLPSRRVEVLRIGAFLTAVVFVAVVLFAPTIASLVRHAAVSGAQPSPADANSSTTSLETGDRLDMTSRPRLSDAVVFTVQANHPDYWRGETWDLYDGSGWQRADGSQHALDRQGDTVHLAVDPDDPAVLHGELMRQVFRVQASYSDMLFAAPTPIEVQSTDYVVGRSDGSMAVPGGIGRGTIYTVLSRRPDSTAATLRASNGHAVPPAILERDGQIPDTTQRVRQLAQQITANAPTAYDKVLAIEHWLGANTKYSLNAPLSPPGEDVVDHFVFDTRVGWCEQVASTLVVMLRSVGVPARVASGFVTGSRDAVNDWYVVREKDAHAWAEVYFPGVGWQGFDPTASVPLAGEAGTASSWLHQARALLPLLAFLAALAALLTAGAIALVRRLGAPRRAPSWASVMLTRLEGLGGRAHVPREGGQTVREYSRALAVQLGEPQLVAVGGAIDTDAFSARGIAPAERSTAEAELSRIEREVRERMSKRRHARVVRSVRSHN